MTYTDIRVHFYQRNKFWQDLRSHIKQAIQQHAENAPIKWIERSSLQSPIFLSENRRLQSTATQFEVDIEFEVSKNSANM